MRDLVWGGLLPQRLDRFRAHAECGDVALDGHSNLCAGFHTGVRRLTGPLNDRLMITAGQVTRPHIPALCHEVELTKAHTLVAPVGRVTDAVADACRFCSSRSLAACARVRASVVFLC